MRKNWDRFLQSLAQTPNVTEACRAAGFTRKAAYKRRESNPAFAAAWDEALEQSIDDLVGECYRRAKDGVEKPILYKGQVATRIREYSDTLAIFLLKAHRRSVYGDKLESQMAGDVKIRVEYADPDDPAPAPAPGSETDPPGMPPI